MPSNPHTEMWCMCINLYLKIKCTYVQYTGLASPFLHWHSCLPCACRIINTRESGILIRLQMLFSYTCSYNCVYWISFFRNLLGFYGFFLLMFNFFSFQYMYRNNFLQLYVLLFQQWRIHLLFFFKSFVLLFY